MVSKFLVFALIISVASAATWRGKLPPKPQEFADKEGCYVKEINDVVPFTTTVTPVGFCYKITCNEALITYASCSAVGTTEPECHVTEEDLTKPYPECCSSVKCPE